MEPRKESDVELRDEAEHTALKATTTKKTIRSKKQVVISKRSSPFKYATLVKTTRTSTDSTTHGASTSSHQVQALGRKT